MIYDIFVPSSGSFAYIVLFFLCERLFWRWLLFLFSFFFFFSFFFNYIFRCCSRQSKYNRNEKKKKKKLFTPVRKWLRLRLARSPILFFALRSDFLGVIDTLITAGTVKTCSEPIYRTSDTCISSHRRGNLSSPVCRPVLLWSGRVWLFFVVFFLATHFLFILRHFVDAAVIVLVNKPRGTLGFPFFFCPDSSFVSFVVFLCNADIYIYCLRCRILDRPWPPSFMFGKRRVKPKKKKEKKEKAKENLSNRTRKIGRKGNKIVRKKMKTRYDGGGLLRCHVRDKLCVQRFIGVDICKFAWYVLLSLHVYRKTRLHDSAGTVSIHQPSTNNRRRALAHVACMCTRTKLLRFRSSWTLQYCPRHYRPT